MRDPQRDRLMPAVTEALSEAAVEPADVERLVCGAGPGSFTSLRIAAAIAKGLAMATGRPLYGVSSLALIVAGVQPSLEPGEYLAVLDALRGEFYIATCTVGGSAEVTEVSPASVVRRDALEDLERAGRRTVGEGRHIGGTPHARGVARLEVLLERDGPVDLATWEPDYGRVAEAQRRWEATHGRAMPHG